MNLWRKSYAGWCTLVDAVARFWLRRQGIECANDVEVYGFPRVRFREHGVIRLGQGVQLVSRPTDNPLGIAVPCTLCLLRPGAKIFVGDHSALSGTVLVSSEEISIGSHVLVGANSLISDTDFHPLSARARRIDRNQNAAHRPVTIEDDVFIGTQVIILKGSSIGRGSVVGAGAVVRGRFPPYSVLLGNPAVKVRSVEE